MNHHAWLLLCLFTCAFVSFFFIDRVSLSSLDWPGTDYINQTLVLLPLLLSAKTTGMCHCGWFYLFSCNVKISFELGAN